MTPIDEIATPHGPAHVHRHSVTTARGLLVLGHGAGGGVAAPDLVLATEVANAAGLDVALVEQPYRVAGRRSSPPPARLDEAWLAVVAALRAATPGGSIGVESAGPTGSTQPLICGGRSAGARVACRTAAAAGATAVLCLAFPLHPPGRPEKSRLPELDAVDVDVLVIQGRRDPFGIPPDAPGREVVLLAGDHGLRADRPGQAAALERWFATVVP